MLLGRLAGRWLAEWFPAGVIEGRPCYSVDLLGVGSRISFRPASSMLFSLTFVDRQFTGIYSTGVVDIMLGAAG